MSAPDKGADLASRIEEECKTLQFEADMMADESLGAPDSESLEAIRRIGLYREQQQEIQRLLQWVTDLHSGMYVNCVYCGYRYGPGETTPVSMADALKAHVEKCPAHPMSALKQENERLRALSEGPYLVVDGEGERFRMMECGGVGWTTEVDKAIWFARRSDADQFAAEDEDAWLIWTVHEAEARRATEQQRNVNNG